MAYQTVLRIPEEVLKGAKGGRYIPKIDLEGLQEFHLTYFLRTSQNNILWDYPCMGASEERLISSRIEGPFEQAPGVKNDSNRPEVKQKVIEFLFPINKEIAFEPVTRVSCGTYLDDNAISYLRGCCRVDKQGLIEEGRGILEGLRKNSNKSTGVKQISDSTYATTINGCLVGLVLYIPEGVGTYPDVRIDVFGKGEYPSQLIRELGVNRLSTYFEDSHARDIAFIDSKREGLAYNLSLDGKTIGDVFASGKVII